MHAIISIYLYVHTYVYSLMPTYTYNTPSTSILTYQSISLPLSIQHQQQLYPSIHPSNPIHLSVSSPTHLPWLRVGPLHEGIAVLVSHPDVAVLESDVELPLLFAADHVRSIDLDHILAFYETKSKVRETAGGYSGR